MTVSYFNFYFTFLPRIQNVWKRRTVFCLLLLAWLACHIKVKLHLFIINALNTVLKSKCCWLMVYNFVVAFILLAVAYDFDVIFYGTVIAVTAAFL